MAGFGLAMPTTPMTGTTVNAQSAKTSGYCAADFTNPYVCGNATYSNYPPQYTKWADLSGAPTHSLSRAMPFVVGLNPVLMEP
jgi:hypothetical protein